MNHFLRLMGQLCPLSNQYKTKLSAMMAVMTLFMCLIAAFKAPAQTGAAADHLEHQVIPYQNEQVIGRVKQNPSHDLDMYPMQTYKINDELIRPIQIGDRIPDEILDLPLWVVSKETTSDTTTLRDIPQNKLLVIDFWASWCKPCVESMNKWEGIRDSLGESVFVLGVHLDYDYKAHPFIKKQGWNSYSAIGINAYVLNRHFFSRTVVSRMAWILDGKLIAMTGTKGYDLELVRDTINGKSVDIPMAYEWTYSPQTR